MFFVKDIITICVALFYTILMVWFFTTSLKLRKINVNFGSQTSHPKYNDDLHSLDKATCLDSLQSSYQLLLEKWPDLKKFTSKKYQRQKLIILESCSSEKQES